MPAVPILSEQELNVLGAKLVKAELLGNNELADKLKAQLAEARSAREQHLEDQVHHFLMEIKRLLYFSS